MMAQIAILAGPAAAGQPESLATAHLDHACMPESIKAHKNTITRLCDPILRIPSGVLDDKYAIVQHTRSWHIICPPPVTQRGPRAPKCMHAQGAQ